MLVEMDGFATPTQEHADVLKMVVTAFIDDHPEVTKVSDLVLNIEFDDVSVSLTDFLLSRARALYVMGGRFCILIDAVCRTRGKRSSSINVRRFEETLKEFELDMDGLLYQFGSEVKSGDSLKALIEFMRPGTSEYFTVHTRVSEEDEDRAVILGSLYACPLNMQTDTLTFNQYAMLLAAHMSLNSRISDWCVSEKDANYGTVRAIVEVYEWVVWPCANRVLADVKVAEGDFDLPDTECFLRLLTGLLKGDILYPDDLTRMFPGFSLVEHENFGTIAVDGPNRIPREEDPDSDNAVAPAPRPEDTGEPKPDREAVWRRFEGNPNITVVYIKSGWKVPARCRISRTRSYAIIEPAAKQGGAYFVLDASQIPEEGRVIVLDPKKVIRLVHCPKNDKQISEFLES